MDTQTLRIEITTASAPEVQGVLIDSVQSSSMVVLSAGEAGSVLPTGGMVLSAHAHGVDLFMGHHALVSTQCVSDVSLLPALDSSLALGNEMILAATHQDASPHAASHAAHGDNVFELAQRLTDVLPKIQSGLQGHLSGSELSGLIHDVQSQLLTLTNGSHALYGEMGSEIQSSSQAMEQWASEQLIASVQADVNTMTEAFASPFDTPHAAQTTLDALFTAPEAFPLTLDFSDSRHVESASELFSSLAMQTSSISSIATGDDSGSPAAGDLSYNPEKS